MYYKQNILTLAETARYLRLSQATVIRLASIGALPVAVIGEELRFYRPHLDKFVKSLAERICKAAVAATGAKATVQPTPAPDAEVKVLTRRSVSRRGTRPRLGKRIRTASKQEKKCGRSRGNFDNYDD